jgi:protein-disulfide isomerase
MNYFLSLCRLPILSLVLSSLFFGTLPARAAAPTAATNQLGTDLTTTSPTNSINLFSTDRVPTSEVLLAQSVKVTPQLEKQILEVLRRHPDVLLDVLQKYAIEQQAKEQKAQAEAIAKIRKNTKALIGDSPKMGASSQQIVMVAFSDFQCPFCATADKSVKQFMAKHKDKVTLVYKFFPLTQIHPEALPAARAAWAANKQGKFWEYHDALYANQAKLGETFYLETATALKLDLKKFDADRKLADNFIVEDFKLGRKLSVEGTPTFIINGEVVTGAASLADLEKALAQVTKK